MASGPPWTVHLRIGDDIGAFMEQSMNATYIILVCTEMFAQKANDRQVAWLRTAVFVGEILTNRELGRASFPFSGLEIHPKLFRFTCGAVYLLISG